MIVTLIVSIIIIAWLANVSLGVNEIRKVVTSDTDKKTPLAEIKGNTSHAFVSCVINGEKYAILLDSGSDTSFLDDRVDAKRTKNKKCLGGIVGINGNDNNVISGFYTKIDVLGKKVSWGFFPTHLPDEVIESCKKTTGLQLAGILGSDFMTRFEISIQYSNKKIRVYEQ